jgi:hypothetical protein
VKGACSDTSIIEGQLLKVSLVIVGSDLSVKETAELFTKLVIAGYDGVMPVSIKIISTLFWWPITALSSFLFFPTFNVVYNHLSPLSTLAVLFFLLTKGD